MLCFFTAHFSRPKVPNLNFFKGFLELPAVDITRCLTNQPVCFHYPPKFNIWNPKMMVSKSGISSISADFQVSSWSKLQSCNHEDPNESCLYFESWTVSLKLLGFFRIVGICKVRQKQMANWVYFFEGAPEKTCVLNPNAPPALLHTATDVNPPETWMR